MKILNTAKPPNQTDMSDTPSNSCANILVFDSGVGGLSIAAEIQKQLPNCQINYCSDNAAFPYGTKGEKELVARVDKVLKAVCDSYGIDIIVIACNSASTLALPHIRTHFKQTIVGVVPAVKPAAQISRSKHIGLLATPGTVSRAYTQKLIDDFAGDCEVTLTGSSELVLLAEQKLRGHTITSAQLAPILKPFENQTLDTLILACTHFPLLEDEIQTHLGKGVTLVDSADAIARRVSYLITKMPKTAASADGLKRENRSIFTAKTDETEALKNALRTYTLGNIEYIDIA